MARNLSLPIIASGAIDLKGISEYDFQVAVTKYAEAEGWKVHYARKTAAMGRSGVWKATGPPGWPDLFMVRGKRAVALELKTEKGKPTEAQCEWLHHLAVANIETDVVKPRDAADIMERLS